MLDDAEDDLDDEAVPYWNAFNLLSTRRKVALGGLGGVIDQPIEYDAISLYAADHGFKSGPRCPDFLDFERLIVAMDEVFLEHMAKVREREAKRATQKGRGGDE